MDGKQPVISGDDLQRYPEMFQFSDGLDNSGLGRIKKNQISQKRHAGFFLPADDRLGTDILVSDSQGTKAFATELFKVLLEQFLYAYDVHEPSFSHFCGGTDSKYIRQGPFRHH